MTEKEKCDTGMLYNPNHDPELLAEIDACNDLCFEFNKIKPSDRAAQGEMLKKIFSKTGKEPTVNAPFRVDYGYKTTVGDYFFANQNCYILDGGGVTFGDYVFIGPNCVFTTADHAIDPKQRREGLETARPIKVGNDVWFGAGVIVLGGVTIGDGSIIGAGSVVTRDIPPNVIAVGNPCRVMRKIGEGE